MERNRLLSPRARPRPPIVEAKAYDPSGRTDHGWDCAYFPPAASDAQIAHIVDEITRDLQHAARLGRPWVGPGARARSAGR
jgi:hypothetical protein